MPRLAFRTILTCILLAVFSGGAEGAGLAARVPPGRGQVTLPGVVVEKSSPEPADCRDGLLAGDVLLSWSCAAGDGTSGGEISSAFVWRSLPVGWLPRGGLTLALKRGGEPLTVALPATAAVNVVPRFAVPFDGLYQEAVDSSERYRARSLLKMLAERHLDFRRDAPGRLAAEKTRLGREYDKLRERVSGISPEKAPEEIREWQDKMADLRERQRREEEEIRAVSPALASLQYPRPVSSGDLERVAGPGVLVLSYSTGESSASLLACLDGRFSAHILKTGRGELSRRVRLFRALLRDPETPEDSLGREARDLYGLLLRPVAPLLHRAERVVICPDGPLWAPYWLWRALLTSSSR